jgi:putative phosphoesterase
MEVSMKVFVVSDSHGEKDNIIKIAGIARKENADMIIHLGDDYDDADFLLEEDIKLERVPGVYSNYYSEDEVENRKIIELGGWKFLLTHTKEKHENDPPHDISPDEMINSGSVNIVLYGHSHIPAIGKEGDVYLINPGHLKSEDKKGFDPSYAVLNIEKDTVDVIIKKLNSGELVLRETITRTL